jgi:Flp pilus assembly protein TadD
MQVRRRVMLALAAVAVVVGTAIVAARGPAHSAVQVEPYRTYLPPSGAVVVARVAPRDPREVALRKVLLASPERVDIAVQLARMDIQKNRTLSDPRYLGRAQATLASWWTLDPPPPDVLLLRAIIRQSLHDFVGARTDLDKLIALPSTPQAVVTQAHLTRAVVSMIIADYAAARQSCLAVAPATRPIVGETCVLLVDATTGRTQQAYDRLVQVVEEGAGEPVELRTWAITGLAEIAIMRGDYATAERHLRLVVDLDGEDHYGRAALADVLMLTRRAGEASALLAGREQIDNLLVRRAIAEHMTSGPDRERLVQTMRDRIAAAAERGDRIHLREEARFTLEVEKDARRALAIALDDFAVQKELADARLVAASAFAANDLAAADPVRSWMTTNRVEDAQLRHWLGGGK